MNIEVVSGFIEIVPMSNEVAGLGIRTAPEAEPSLPAKTTPAHFPLGSLRVPP